MRNKITMFTMLLSMVSIGTWAQSQETEKLAVNDSNKQRNEVDQRIYQRALRYNDPGVAKDRLYDLIERNPENSRYMELLGNLYFDMEQYSSAALVALDLIKSNDKNTTALEIAAYSMEQLGALDRALPHFESLYLLSGNLFSLYKTAYLQFSLKKYDEALNSVNMLIKNKKATEENLSFPKKDNTNQEVSIKVAGLNLKGLIYKEQGNAEEARVAFEEALEESPDFELAKENLDEL